MADVLPSFSLRLPCHSRIPLVASVSPDCTQFRRPRRSVAAAVSVVLRPTRNTRFAGLLTHAVVAEDDGPKWWEKNVENMIDVHSTEDFLQALNEANDKLVVVEFYGTWCASCRALFPKLCKTAEENPDIVLVKVNFDENKPMCKRLNVRVLPYFHFYRGADGQLDSFSCSFAKFQKVKDAIATHNTARCSIGPPTGVGDIGLLEGAFSKDKPAEATR